MKKGKSTSQKKKRVATYARKENKMTYREFYNTVINGEVNADAIEFAKNAIAKLDERNAKRASQPSKQSVLNEPIKAEILAWLEANGTHLAKEVGEALHLTTAKTSALLGQLTKEGKVVAEEVKVAKVGKRMAYTVA